MKKVINFILCFSVLQLLNGQDSGNYNYNNNNRAVENIHQSPPPNAQLMGEHTMLFNVNALINEKADAFLAIFNIQQVGATATEANQLVQERYESFLQEAMKTGLSKEDIYIDMVSLVPVYEYEVEKKIFSKRYNEIPKGFELQKNIHIVYKNASMLDQFVAIAADFEIYDLIKVEYYVEDTEKVYDNLRDKAVALVNKKLASFEKLGIEMDTVFRVVAEASDVKYPIERYRKYQAFSSSSVDVIKKRDTVKPIKKQTSMFYEKVPYNGYDIVINPTILEPAVQYTYNLKVQFFIKHPPKTPQIVTKKEKEFIWLTPEGDVKSLKVD